MILRGVLHRDALAALARRRGDHRIHRSRQALLLLLFQEGERPHRLLIRHAGDDAVRRLIIELEKMRVNIDLRGLEVCEIVVLPFAGERPVHTVVHARAEHQRKPQVIILSNCRFLLMEHVDEAGLVYDRLFFAMSLADFNRHFNEMDVVILPPRVLRTETPDAVLAWSGWIDTLAAVIPLANHLQPWRRIVVMREHHALAEMWLEVRPRNLAGARLEEERHPLAGLLRFVPGIGNRALLLGHGGTALPRPIHHRGIIGDNLFFLVGLVTRQTLVRKLHFDPIFNRHDGRVALPIGLAFVDNLEGLAEPI